MVVYIPSLKSCSGVMKLAYSVCSTEMNGERIVSTGQNGAQKFNQRNETGQKEEEKQSVSDKNQRQHMNRIGCG